jgi:hypothetical protein
MSDLDYVRAEIERMRARVGRHRKEIQQLQRAGMPTASAEALLARRLTKNRRALRRARQTQKRAGLLSHQGQSPGRALIALPVDIAFLASSFGATILYARPIDKLITFSVRDIRQLPGEGSRL